MNYAGDGTKVVQGDQRVKRDVGFNPSINAEEGRFLGGPMTMPDADNGTTVGSEREARMTADEAGSA